MKPPLNASKKTKTVCGGSLKIKKSKKHLKKISSVVTEVDKPKTSCNYSETKKVKQFHSVIPNLNINYYIQSQL